MGEKINLSIMVLQKHGIEIPQQLFYYSQSELRLQNSIKDVIKEIVKLKTAVNSLDRLNVGQMEQWSDAVLLTQGTAQGNVEDHYKNVISALTTPS